jgi:tRNA1Val (adenine37-N6)-methyltransferase
MNLGFQFKQFYIAHDRCAMKVGTDGVLLGAWATTDQVPLSHLPCTILDVGTGSGLVALMLAQRFPQAQIDAIDIDEAAVSQATDNFLASPWSDRLHAYYSKVQEWKMVHGTCPNGKGYDLIVSNPPYFRNSLKNPDKGREMARHTDTLSYDELLRHSARLLAQDGTLALILPADTEQEVTKTAKCYSLYPVRVTRVYSKLSKPTRRVLLCFTNTPSLPSDSAPGQELPCSPFTEDTLVLEDAQGARSAAYKEITKDFYL